MSQLLVDDIVDKDGGNSVGFSKGINVGASSTITGNLNVTGVLTYEDVTNVDSVGLITARGGIKLGAAGVGGTIRANGDTTLAGVVTATSFSGDGSALTGMANTANVNTAGLNVVGVATVGAGLTLADDVRAKFGNAGDLQIYHSSNEGWIKNDTGTLNILNDNILQIKSLDDSKTAAQFNAAGEVQLRYNDSVKLRTISSGVNFPEVVDIAGDLQVTGITTVGILTAYGLVKVAGITSTASLTVGPGIIQEKFYNQGSALTGTYNHDLNSDGMVLYAYANASASFILNVRGDASTTLNSLMHIGQTSVFTAYTGSNNTSYYMTDFKIDGASQTEKWNGGSAPTAGTGSGTDVYTFNILKTADATFAVFANFSNFA